MWARMSRRYPSGSSPVILADSMIVYRRRRRRRNRSRRTNSSFGSKQSRGHSAHIGQNVVFHYHWHPLYGRTVRRIQIERRATGEYVYVELTPGVVTVLPAWKLDAVYCAGLKVGTPRVSLAALCALHELLLARESQQLSADGNTVTQETQDGIAESGQTEYEACSELAAHAGDITTTTRPRSRRRATAGHDSAGAPSRTQSAGTSATRGKWPHNGGRR